MGGQNFASDADRSQQCRHVHSRIQHPHPNAESKDFAVGHNISNAVTACYPEPSVGESAAMLL